MGSKTPFNQLYTEQILCLTCVFKPKQLVQKHVLKNIWRLFLDTKQTHNKVLKVLFHSTLGGNLGDHSQKLQVIMKSVLGYHQWKEIHLKHPFFSDLNFRNFNNQQTCLYLKYNLHPYFRELCIITHG